MLPAIATNIPYFPASYFESQNPTWKPIKGSIFNLLYIVLINRPLADKLLLFISEEIYIATLFTLLSLPLRSYSLGILDDIANDNSISDLITENILAISPSKRVFFITNENRTFTKGDFISFVFNAS